MERTIIITGASRGIGAAAAKEFAAQGWKVIGTATTKKQSNIPNLTFYPLNLAEARSITAFCRALQDEHIIPTHLINNAGINGDQASDSFSLEDLHNIIQVNLIGTVSLTEALLPLMPNGSRIIMVGSHAGNIHRDTMPGTMVPYRLSKATLNMYTRTLATRLKERQFTVAELYPGWVKTDMGSAQAPKDPSAVAHELYNLACDDIPNDSLWDAGTAIQW